MLSSDTWLSVNTVSVLCGHENRTPNKMASISDTLMSRSGTLSVMHARRPGSSHRMPSPARLFFNEASV